MPHERPPTAYPTSEPAACSGKRGLVLVVDDEEAVLRLYARALGAAGFEVKPVSDSREAAKAIVEGEFDVIVSDISMPELDGLQLLRKAREHDLDIPVILMTGAPALATAVKAVEVGALRYLVKPFHMTTLVEAVDEAVNLRRLAKAKREALELLGESTKLIGDRAGLEASFARAVQGLHIVYQPIVRWSTRSVYGYEALVRSREASLPDPYSLFDAADRLNAHQALGRAIRARVIEPIDALTSGQALFVNIHANELLDDSLFDDTSPLARHSDRIVIEITERDALDGVKDARARVQRLKDRGFRIAIDDLGAGYAGLTSFAVLEPDLVKIDMSLVRNVHLEPAKRKLVRAIVSLSADLGMAVVAEGVENAEERDVLVDQGCDLLQGYYFARPGPAFPVPNFSG
jgi:EAL domain-containing protein (putative c-di-GMP-specific phosphodiesterase class I)